MRKILSLLKEFDIANLLPAMDTFVAQIAGWLRLFVLAGPVALLILGLWYKKSPQKEIQYQRGYRSKYSILSQATWDYAQALAGQCFFLLGAILTSVSLILSLFFGMMTPVVMAVVSLVCILVQGGLILGTHLFIEKMLRQNFNRNGIPYRK